MNNATSKVFVTQYVSRLDYTELNKYGEVIFLTKKEYAANPVPNGVNEIVTAEIKAELSKYIPGVDYIVTTGSAMPNVVAGAIVAGIAINGVKPKHKFLKWSNRDHRYDMFEILL